MDYKIELEVFEGPMDLLLHLINNAKMDIYDIPINLITEQFMDYLRKMEDLNLDIASEFLVMASSLIEIKSKMLLPKEIKQVDEEDPREDLVSRLIEYKKYKQVSKELKELNKKEAKVYYKPKEDLFENVTNIDLKNLELEDLIKSINNIIKRHDKRENKLDITEIQREEYNIEDCMEKIQEVIMSVSYIYFTDLLGVDTTRTEIVAYFIALLELIKVKKLTIQQENYYDIKILRLGD